MNESKQNHTKRVASRGVQVSCVANRTQPSQPVHTTNTLLFTHHLYSHHLCTYFSLDIFLLCQDVVCVVVLCTAV